MCLSSSPRLIGEKTVQGKPRRAKVWIPTKKKTGPKRQGKKELSNPLIAKGSGKEEVP